MAVYQRGENWYIDFTFHGQRIRDVIAVNNFLDISKDLDPIKFHDFANEYLEWAWARIPHMGPGWLI